VIKKILTPFLLIGISLVLISWGGTGHYKINNNSSLSFNSEMSMFTSWTTYLRDHASDADSRKYASDPNYDPNESIRHYINIDNYSDFISNGSITQNFESAVIKYGQPFINNSGTLPWATQIAFDSLTNCLKRNDITKAKQFAADLGHYVGDGHMPLHITKNYNGQLTGNYGIHSKYESNMIDTYNSQLTYTGEEISVITDVNQYIFDYIYASYKYKDSILLADTYAKTQSNYNQALWDKTKGYTTKLFKNASHALAELIYTSWVRSQATSAEQNANINFTEVLEQNTPNPFTAITSIKYNLSENTDISLRVKDILGNTVLTLYEGFQSAGSYKVDWIPQNQPEGMYFVILDTRKVHKVKKMILVR
jgi:hypothetical protein